MKHLICMFGVVAMLIGMWVGEASAQVASKAARNQEDPIAFGKPLSHWLNVIRTRDPEAVETAYDAIVELGPAAWRAVPELTHIVAEPFSPIQIGKDDRREVLAKLLDIHLRAGAVDSLGAIGEAAASAAQPVIDWALTIRVLPAGIRSQNDAFYIELIGMDVLERMRGAGATARFGVRAADAVQELMESGDDEKIKFAIAILNEGSLPIATDLMTSTSCRDQILGLKILADMWSVVAMDHFKALKEILVCPSSQGTGAGTVHARSGKSQLPAN